MTYRIFAFLMAFMFIGIGGYYMYQERGVFFSLSQNKQETSDILNDQIRLASIDRIPLVVSVDTGSSTTGTSSNSKDDAVAGEILAGNYSSDEGIEVIIKRNKKALFVIPASAVKKGNWKIISNNILSITVSSNGVDTKYLFSIEDPEREIVEIKSGDTTIYSRH